MCSSSFNLFPLVCLLGSLPHFSLVSNTQKNRPVARLSQMSYLFPHVLCQRVYQPLGRLIQVDNLASRKLTPIYILTVVYMNNYIYDSKYYHFNRISANLRAKVKSSVCLRCINAYANFHKKVKYEYQCIYICLSIYTSLYVYVLMHFYKWQ